MSFNEETTATEVLEGQDLTGKRVVITGCSGGIGLETAKTLAQIGANIVMANRDSEKSDKAFEELSKEFPDADISHLSIDLSSLESVREFADKYMEKYDDLHLLINNAGIMACPQSQTQDGFETQFGVNHLGHFVLTSRLMPVILKSAPARVVNLSSGAHRTASVDIADPNFENRTYEKWVSYGQSKTANILFSLELNRRLEDTGVMSFSVHPGMILTDLSRHMTEEDMLDFAKRIDPANNDGQALTRKSIPAGAATTVWAATAAELESHGGVYLEDCNVANPKSSDTDLKGYAPYAKDGELAKQLWELSEKLVGETFNLN